MLAKPPFISVVIPTFNQRPDFLRETLKAALAQTYDNFEVVLSENHSTNGADKVALEFDDPRLRIVRPPQHLPMVPHFEFAGRQANGEYISFLCSDDLVTPDWLEQLVPALSASPQSVFAFGEIANVKHDQPDEILYTCRQGKLPTGSYSPAQMLKIMVPFNRASSWLVGDLIRTEAYLAVGGMAQPNIRFSGDYALALRLLERGGAVYVNRLVGLHRRWEAADGKADSKRALAAISDTTELFKILDTSSTLQSLSSDLKRDIIASKKSKAILLALLLLEAVAMREINRADAAEPVTKIRSLDNSLAVRTILLCARLPMVPGVIRTFHGAARSVYRAYIAPWLNRSKG